MALAGDPEAAAPLAVEEPIAVQFLSPVKHLAAEEDAAGAGAGCVSPAIPLDISGSLAAIAAI